MMRRLLDRMPGQHVYLFSDDAVDFYKKIGFTERPVGLEIVVGRWLDKVAAAVTLIRTNPVRVVGERQRVQQLMF